MDLNKTSIQYQQVQGTCKAIFSQKMEDYGTNWRVLRPSGMVDQIFIKARRIRSLEEKKSNLVGEPIENDYIGIINYCIMGIIQIRLGTALDNMEQEMDTNTIQNHYNSIFDEAFQLMISKNHDYDEAWRIMMVSSFTDLILSRVFRIRHIMENKGQLSTLSEGIDSNLFDMINYAIFAMIRLSENE